MALGPDHFNLTIDIDRLFVFQGDDIDALTGGPASEPYLWVFIVKIDGEGLRQQGNFLVGEPVFRFPAGSHGNIGGSIQHGTRRIPDTIGRHVLSLQPIPISVAGQQLGRIPGVILAAAVLMEENLTPNSAVEEGRKSVANLIRTTVNSTIASMGLAGLAADAAAEVATDASNGITTSLAQAAQRTIERRLRPIQDLFTVAAPANTAVTILQKLDIGGFIGSAIDADKPMGVWNRLFTQGELAATTQSAPFAPAGNRIEFTGRMFNMPEWAFNLHGSAWAHRKFVRRALPDARRLQVSCSYKRLVMAGPPRIAGIGGTEGGNFWAMGRQEAAIAINEGRREFFVRAPDGSETKVHAVQGGFEHGRPWFFLQTSADQFEENNLGKLPNCPSGGDQLEIWF
jgi:hypothetical protein